MQNELYLTIHGMNWSICCEQQEILGKLANDFFVYKGDGVDSDSGETLTLHSRCLSDKRRGDIKFKGGVVVRRDYLNNSASIFCSDIDRLHEMSYLYILSVLGKYLDRQGFHRIHASAVGINGSAHLFVGASGMGKSHLSYLLPYETLADDMLFVNKDGVCLPMLHRRGFNSSKSRSIDLKKSYSMKRLEYGEKELEVIEDFCEQKTYSLKAFYFLKESKEMTIRSASFWEKFRYLFLYLFIGLGTPQMIKLFWEPGGRDFIVKFKILNSRLFTFLKLLTLNEAFTLGTTKSFETVNFVECQLFESKTDSHSRLRKPLRSSETN